METDRSSSGQKGGGGWVRWSSSVLGILSSHRPQLKQVSVHLYTVVATVGVSDGPSEAKGGRIVGEYVEGSTIEVVDVSEHHDPQPNYHGKEETVRILWLPVRYGVPRASNN